MTTTLTPLLLERSGGACELCRATDAVAPFAVAPRPDCVAACATCRGQLAGALDPRHWFCLQETAWSEHPPVQVVSWRVLGRLGEAWAQDLQAQLYLDDDTLAWAREGGETEAAPNLKVVDSNGAALADGDSVTLIKDLDVKGAGFVAKRGTLVKGIRLTNDPALVEGKVNKTAIYLRTEFLKKA